MEHDGRLLSPFAVRGFLRTQVEFRVAASLLPVVCTCIRIELQDPHLHWAIPDKARPV